MARPKPRSRPWDDLTDNVKHAVWSAMDCRNRARAWLEMTDRDRRMIERADALAAVKARGMAPGICGPMMGCAPARGRLIPFMPVFVLRDAKGEEQQIEAGHVGRHAARVGDVWDRMEDQARRSGGGFLFDPAQVEAGRDYAALVQRINSSGMSGSSMEVVSGRGGGSGGTVSEAVAHDVARLRGLRARIGPGLALEIRRVRPSVRGKRRALHHLDLVDMVCLGGKSVVEVLQRCGWPKKGDSVKALRAELCLCLDRMSGAAPRYRSDHKMQKRD